MIKRFLALENCNEAVKIEKMQKAIHKIEAGYPPLQIFQPFFKGKIKT